MSERKSLVCIVCPVGCKVEVQLKDGQVESLEGNKCKRGYEYAWTESIRPVRTLTSTMKVLNGKRPLVSVKSEQPLPKNLLPECMKKVNEIEVQAPVRIRDRLICNILGTGIDIIATCDIDINKEGIEKS